MLNIELTYDSAFSFIGINPRQLKTCSHEILYTVFIRAIFILGQKWKPQCLLIIEWINQRWYIHTMDYYLSIKRNEMLIYVITWINLENINYAK